MKYQVPYGDGHVAFDLPVKAKVLLPRKTRPLADPEKSIREALSCPIGGPPFAEALRTDGRVAIIVNDETRVAKTEVFFPILVEELNRIGIEDGRIFAVIANGTHRPMTREEIGRKVSDLALERIRVYNHYCRAENAVYAGRTRAGTEVFLNRRVMEADKLILTGSILYHFFAGYGGGRKSLFPGTASLSSILQNHIMSIDPQATFGKLAGNPVEEDFQDAVALRKPDFLLNTVLDEDKNIVGVVAGDYRKAHEAGCRIVDRVYGCPVREPADLVIAGCGGYPKDINVFQAHKTMENAFRIVKPGGAVILLAECRDGIGPRAFVESLRRYNKAEEIRRQLLRKFEFGAHKSYFLARLTEKADLFLVSSLPRKSLTGMFLKPMASMEEALAAALAKLGGKPQTYLLPQGGLVFPWLEKSKE